MKKSILVFIVIAALLGACSHAPFMSQPTALDRILEKGELVVGTAASMPPLNMTTKEGDIIGLEPDVARLIAAGMGVKLRLEAMAFSDLLSALEAGSIDMILSGMTMTPQRNLKVAFVGPYFLSGKAFLSKIETITNVKDVKDINTPETRLAALKGSTSQYFVEELIDKAQLTAVSDYDEGVKLVIDDKVHALVADYQICVVSVFRYPEAGLGSLIAPLTYEPIGIAVARDNPHLVNWLENFLGSLEGSGRLDDLEARWMESGDWLQKLP